MEELSPALILFDLDGTLVDTAGAGKRSMERAFEEVFGVEAIASRAAPVRFAGKTDPWIFQTLARAAGIPDPAFEVESDRLHRAYLRALELEMARPDPRRRVLPGVGSLLALLAGRPGVHLGLLTGNLERGARIKLGPFGLNRFFADGGFGSDDPDRRRVARIARDKLSERTGVAFADSRVVVVGDTDQDVDCARANDFRVVAVASGWISRETLLACRPDALVSDLEPAPALLAALGLEDGTPPRPRPILG